jgi:hypothetical protein
MRLHVSLALAYKATRLAKYSTRPASSSSSGATRTARRAFAVRASSSSVMGEGLSKVMIRSRPGSGFVARPLEGSLAAVAE